jgi:hypothetical protein
MHSLTFTALLAWALAGGVPDDIQKPPLASDSILIHATSDRAPEGGDDPGAAPSRPSARPAPDADTESFQMRPAAAQAAIFTGVMHAKRFISEAGTRDALHGPFWADYFASVEALRGWDDRDGFLTSYIGHPMEGAVFHFIEVQNDPRYRALVFNQGRDYWIRCLRGLAFSAVWSTQWTLGLASEASLGNVQLHSSPGLVDLVVTPTVGTGWAIGEDAVDRYLIARLEEHTANRFLLMMVRGFANPTRSFANAMGGRRPWQRDSRPGLFGSAFAARSDDIRRRRAQARDDGFDRVSSDVARLVADPPKPKPAYPIPAPIELQAAFQYESFLGGGSCVGGGGQGALRLAPTWQFIAEVSGCLIVNMPTSQSGDSLLYLAGVRWTPRAGHRVSPYSELLFGGRKVTHEVMDSELRDKLQNDWDAGHLAHYPLRSDYSVEHSVNGFTVVVGGGVDINLHAALTVRVANLEYARSFIPVVDRIDAQRGIRFSSGLVLRIGTW